MTELDYLKLKLKDKEKAFDKLHKLHMESLKKQGELEKENEGIQNKVWDLIDYLELKYGIDKKEVKEYWNNGGDVE